MSDTTPTMANANMTYLDTVHRRHPVGMNQLYSHHRDCSARSSHRERNVERSCLNSTSGFLTRSGMGIESI